MSRAMSPSENPTDPGLLDEDAWDSPDRLTEADLFAHAGTARRLGGLHDPEDER
jgi:hypothetical protein